MADDLVVRLLAAIDETEQAAQAASAGGRWRYADGDSVGAWTLYDEHWAIASLKTYRRDEYDYSARMPAARHPRYVDADANGQHIARHDPDAVLRRCAADRELIADLLAEKHDVNGEDPWYTCSAATEERDGGVCSNELSAFGSCDCGRDDRVARRLKILADGYGITVQESS